MQIAHNKENELPANNNNMINRLQFSMVPYEIHMVEFKTEKDFDGFKNDEERRNILHLKKDSIQSSILIQGAKVN